MVDFHQTYLTIIAALIALNALQAIVNVLAWRWRPPGEARNLTRFERKVCEMFG